MKNHKLKIYTVAVTAVALLMTYNTARLVGEAGDLVVVKAEVVACPSLTDQLEARAYELREEKGNKAMDLERYRQEALREQNLNIQDLIYISPFVDFAELKEEHGN